MTITQETVTAIAPDQASLKAASKLMKTGKWPVRQMDTASLVWGECQGSGANPYLVVFDKSDQGYKCTCPSRKFPCKHVLALMWMYADTPSDFGPGETPQWVSDWLGRRRKTGGASADEKKPSTTGKSLTAALADDPEESLDPKAEARKKAAAEKRAADTEAALMGAMDDLETWVADQLRTGLSGLMGDLAPRCRAIAARMVDGKAQALAGRLDELPARLMTLPGDERLDALIGHLGKLVLLARAFRADPKAPDVRRAIGNSETRERVLEDKDALRVKARWEVAGERISTRRDGLVSQATWLLNLDDGPQRFALLLDFFPASIGKRTSSFVPGDQFLAELVFYPSSAPLRAVMADRSALEKRGEWPAAMEAPLSKVAAFENKAPWEWVSPMLLPAGRIVVSETDKPWWQSSDGALALPVEAHPPDVCLGMDLQQTAALWDGTRLALLSATTTWGRVSLDA